MVEKIVIAGACRTPIGVAFKGKLAELTATDLLVTCFKETLKRVGIAPLQIDEVIAGQVAQSSDAPNIARVAFLKAFSDKSLFSVPAHTVQRNCGSGLQALTAAADRIRLGDAKCILVGGTESMSNIGFRLPGDVRKGIPYSPRNRHTLIDDLDEGLTDPITGELMGKTADNVAEKYEVSRMDQDKYAAKSHKLAFRAQRGKKFDAQIAPVDVKGPRGMKPETVTQDEGINMGINEGVLSRYPAVFSQHGSVTPGNACQLSDGAASFMVMSKSYAKKIGITPDAEVVSYAFAGCEPSYMGMGPAYAIPEALRKVDLELKDIELFEINEAFAAQVLACQKELGIPDEKLNLWGGAISMGHPVGATGAILTAKMAAMLKEMDQDLGVVSMCIGGGQGGALVLESPV